MVQPIKKFSEFLRTFGEDVAVNSAGGGAVAGLGVGPQGEPGVRNRSSKKKPSMLRRAAYVPEEREDGALELSIPVIMRMLEIAREHIKSDDELHLFVEALMDINVTEPLTMDDVAKVFSYYGK